MDTTGIHAKHKAEHIARQAAADAHASYYAHPSLHAHTYLPPSKHAADTDVGQGDTAPGENISSLNGPYQGKTTGQRAEETGDNEGTKEEEGGKMDAAPPTGLDKGAREIGAEAGGTLSSPGPTFDAVQRAKAAAMGQSVNREAEQTGINGEAAASESLQAPSERPGLERHWSVSQAMEPHLQLMCGPLLSYHTILNDVWYGAALVVTADEGSVFEPTPSLSLTFHASTIPSEKSPTLHSQDTTLIPPKIIPAQNIHTYSGMHGSSSFWRFMIEIPIQTAEMTVRYRLNNGAEMDFVVPAKGQNLRWAAHSCNGFSSGVNPDDFKGEYQSGYDPVWEDLLLRHHQRPFHCMVGGGDQIYCDAITREPELQPWINAPDRKSKLGFPLSDEIKSAVDRFYFNHYCKIFRSNAFGRANSTIPMVNMLDDHDLIDGFGTYDDETQSAPVMSFVGSRGYFWFLLFQLFVVDKVDGIDPTPGTHPVKSLIIGSPGAWIPFWSHSLSVYLGPKVHMLAIDCRAERKLHRIVSPETYDKLFKVVATLSPQVEQLVVLLGVPIAYPRMSFLEHFLGLSWNPVNILARHNALGLGSMVNKFNQASELLDDLNDHWCANVHKKERNWLVLEMQRIAQSQRLRVTFLSGDVHLAAAGCLFTYKPKLAPDIDHRYMLNIVTSAIVNTPPPAGAARMVAMLSSNKHRTLPKNTDETMVPLFSQDTDGSHQKRPFVLARRNYASVEYLESGDLQFEIRVEKSQGSGETVAYPIKTPPPRWERA